MAVWEAAPAATEPVASPFAAPPTAAALPLLQPDLAAGTTQVRPLRQAAPTARLQAALRKPQAWIWLLALIAVTPETYNALTAHGDVLVDLHVYRQAGVSLLHHRPVYAEYVNTQYSLLPFTYPPLAAVLAVPLALVPLRVAGLVWDLAVLAVLAWALRLLLAPTIDRIAARSPRLVPWVVPAAFVGASYLVPFHQQLKLGQVGAFLLGLVLLDLLTPRTGRFRGVLIGVATAVKLTPGLFVLSLLLARRWRDAAMAVVGFLAVVALVWVVAPGTSSTYWTDDLFHADRLGNNASPANQSLRGLVLRTGLTGLPSMAVLAVAIAVVGAAGLYATTRAWRSGDDLLAVSVAGLLSCLLSPVAWTHHYVYLLPLLAWLLRESRYALVVVLAYLWSFNWAARQYQHQGQGGVVGALWQLLGDEFVLVATAVVLWFAVRAWRSRRPESRPASALVLV